MQSGLCAKHFEKLFTACQYCPQPIEDAALVWRSCTVDGCFRSVRLCEKCLPSLEDPSLICEPCWRAKGSLCVMCHETPSQTHLRYARRCGACFSNIDNATKRVLVQAESEAYLQSIAQQQEWTGYEAPLQLLVLPAPPTSPLPTYSQTPDYLDPQHCRLCFESLSNTTLELHLAKTHPDLTVATYRRKILQTTVTEWPQAISPQVLRSRLAAFKQELCDANFGMAVCASCARQKRRSKLVEITFPSSEADMCLAWLPWSPEEWIAYRTEWYEQLDDLFNIENYLVTTFRTVDNLQAAQNDVLAFEDGSTRRTSFTTKTAAEAWLRRVEH